MYYNIYLHTRHPPKNKQTVDYIFVSRLWTLGRTLDEVVGKHQAALRQAYPDADVRVLFFNFLFDLLCVYIYMYVLYVWI